MNTQFARIALATTTAVAASILIACGGGGGSDYSGGTPTPNPVPPVTTTGTLAVSMTDAPSCGFDQVNVTVNKVRVNASGTASETDSGWTDITLSPAKKINLLSLTNGVLEALGQTALATGHYSQLRLVLDGNTSNGLANSVIPTGSTTEVSLDTPSAVTSGIKLNHEFDVAAGQKVDLVLDFDACKSVLTKGNGQYALKPVVKVIPTALNGITGFIATSALAQSVTISAQQNGVVMASTTPNASTGEFFLARLAPGNYDVVITATNFTATVIGAVPVATTTSVTALSTLAAPIVPVAGNMGSVSGVVTMTPPSATAAAFVTAKQSFASGPSVTIRYAGADLTTGAYAIENLPTGAPSYAAYSATLPLVFAAATTSPGTGKYQLEASATGYTTKVEASVDVAVVAPPPPVVNFALVP